ncbi:MAG: CehA/McbA family metallohydrolase [Vicinamibacteraceae bacterium]
MRRRRVWGLGALAMVALAVLAAPPGPRATRSATFTIAAPAVARGVVHVHSTRSDGSGSIDEIAAAAARSGLQFVVVTDHGDGTRQPFAPAYRAGVLVIDGVEISTTHGHYLAFGLGQAPYRLAGDAADVVDDVRRLGGFGVVAHPDSPKPALAWRDWQAPIDGLEWFNLDSEWRDDSALRLTRALIYYPFRPVPSLALLAGDAGAMLPRWAALAAQRRVLGLAAIDAHARLGSEGGFDRAWVNVRAPGYETLFETAQVSVELEAVLSGVAAGDAAVVLHALRDGRTFSTVTARAPAGRIAILAERGGLRARMGQFLPGAGAVTITVEGDAPRDAVIRIACDGRTITQTFASPTFSRTLDPDEAGHACQAVVGWPGGSADRFVVWAVSNPIYLRPADPIPTPQPAAIARRSEAFAASASDWTVEHAAGSTASAAPVALAGPGTGPGPESASTPVALSFELAPGERAGQYAALVTSDIGTISWARWLLLDLDADAPMRVSVQLREPTAGGGRRWQRSLVLGPARRTHLVPLASFLPVAEASGPVPGDRVRSLLIVVDTVNTPPGRRGSVVVRGLRAEAP